ncbi:hypothetical protein JI721_11325 [Alicyclobacillus cycloheptanicus]|uniref:Uncharacterized protein n=1 Tax=Alicyclobacillus cycloheptanicus TaxID=1457 RepID=A0ABT9XM69_9BACL|nr:hypothetical protein [Alicyclobacillus cycloheptanicus]MDQ0191410.1 hypothetical protein [Alicyclobacillus cycloheptanicus]WDM00326.1 hypothetical protein JI721_11325 [Alicyclobacillus cycloheptanicus]
MGDSKTFNYPKANSASTSSQAGHDSRVASRKPAPHPSQNLVQEDLKPAEERSDDAAE